jgi:hypothetical protein
MLFKKIRFPKTSSETAFSAWYMVIRTEEELLSYLDTDEHYMANAFFSPNVSTYKDDHPAKLRLPAANAIREMAQHIPHGTKVWPHELLAKHVSAKGTAMLKHLQHGPIQVNEAGGYCNHEAFLRTWPGSYVVQELEQESKVFPEKHRGLEARAKFDF